MNKDLVKIALVGLTAGFCLTAEAAPSKKDKEIAMSKCTKDNGQKKNGNGNGNGNGSCSSCGSSGSDNGDDSSCSSCNSQGNQSDAQSQVKEKRKSAAQKVLYGK